MLYVFAIDPDVLTTWDKCRNALHLMGFQHGRAIAAYPSRRRWKALVRDACNANAARGTLGARDRARIIRSLNKSNSKFVSSAATYDATLRPVEERWIRNATSVQSTEHAFHAILSTRNPGNHPDVVLEEDIEEWHPKLDVPREALVLREPQPVAAHIGTLVRNCGELHLIDPHFDPSQCRWRPVIAACIAVVGETADTTPSKVTVHTLDADDKPSLDEFERRCQKHMPAMLTETVKSIRICRWRLRDNAPHDFHARYVLTDRGGYRLDKGLDEESGVSQSIELLSDGAWQRLREGFTDANPFFEKDGEFTVPAPPPGVGGRRR